MIRSRYSVVSVIFTRMFDTQCQADTSMSRHCDTVTLQSPLAVLSCRSCVVRAWCARASFARVSGAPSPSGSVDTLPLRPFRTPPGSLRKFVTQFVTQVRYASSFRKFVTQVRYASSFRKFVTPVRYAGSCTVCLAVMSSYAP